jgi:GntR family transcriptional regulator
VVPPRPADSFVHEVMSINDLVAFATGVRFAVDTIEMIEIDDKLSARTGIVAGERWLSVRGFRHTEGSDLPACSPARSRRSRSTPIPRHASAIP